MFRDMVFRPYTLDLESDSECMLLYFLSSIIKWTNSLFNIKLKYSLLVLFERPLCKLQVLGM